MGISFKDLEKYLFGADHAAAVTPSDTAALSPTCRRLFVGGAGAVKIDTAGGQTGVVFTAVGAGTFLDVHAVKVYATGTTATAIIALW